MIRLITALFIPLVFASMTRVLVAEDVLVTKYGEGMSSLIESASHDSLLSALELARYTVDQVGDDARASNPDYRFRMTFSGNVMQLESTLEDNAWGSHWSLESFGYGEAQMSAQVGELSISGARVENIRAQQGITEWLVNSAEGMEHGFTLVVTPAGRLEGTLLRLVIGITGDLKAYTDGEQDLVLANREGEDVLRYQKLKVWDANGKILSARMRMGDPEKLWIEVDDAGASYPVTIDPTFITEAKLLASDGRAGDEFGFDVAIDGNTAVIGAHRADVGANSDQGAVYVFIGSGTIWTLQQKLTASDGTAQNDFGGSVAIQGDTLFVGAPARDSGVNSQVGKVYVFTRSGTVWTQSQGLVASDGKHVDRFGDSVSLDGDYAIIGASQDTLKGSAYIFTKSAGSWTQQQKIAPADGSNSDDFGLSVSISGNTAVIGAPAGNGAEERQGVVYVYVRNGSSWSLQSKLIASNETGFLYFGYDVSISGDTVLVSKRGGAPVYVFVRNGTTWTEQQKLIPLDKFGSPLYSAFRVSVSLSGNTAAIGWAGDVVGNISQQGAVCVFERSGTSWAQSQILTATDGLANDLLGFSVAVNAWGVVSGAILDDEASKNSQGSAYIFYTSIPDIDVTVSFDVDTKEFTMEWNTQPGRMYSIEGSTDLNGFPINVVPPFAASSDTATYKFTQPAAPEMFYRVKETAP